jgi:hypothetical protein
MTGRLTCRTSAAGWPPGDLEEADMTELLDAGITGSVTNVTAGLVLN